MTVTLDEVVSAYLGDISYQKDQRELVHRRNETLPQIQSVVHDFLQRRCNIYVLRQKLDVPRELMGAWFAQGPGFMMELNKFAKNHNDTG